MTGKRFVRRKWGWYITLLDRRHFKVKILRFKSGRACSFQYHLLREELWLFLTGGGKFSLYPHEYRSDDPRGEFQAYDTSVVKVGKMARHQYLATSPTYILEIQYGEKCVEEDIVRV